MPWERMNAHSPSGPPCRGRRLAADVCGPDAVGAGRAIARDVGHRPRAVPGRSRPSAAVLGRSPAEILIAGVGTTRAGRTEDREGHPGPG